MCGAGRSFARAQGEAAMTSAAPAAAFRAAMRGRSLTADSLPVNGAHLDVAGGQPGWSGRGPDFEPHPRRLRLVAGVRADVDDAGEDALRIRAYVAQRRLDHAALHGLVGLVDDVGAIAVAAFLPHPGEEVGLGRLQEDDLGGEPDAGASGPVLNEGVDAAGQRSGREDLKSSA